MAAISIADLENAKQDVDTIDAFANSPASTVTTRMGDEVLTRAGVTALFPLAELYAAVGATGTKFFDTIALGRAAVADGASFGVKAGGSDGLTRPTIYRRESSSTQTLLYQVVPASEYDAAVGPLQTLTQDISRTRQVVGFRYALTDDDDVGFGVDDDFQVHAAGLLINGERVRTSDIAISRRGGAFPYQLNFINNYGESTAEGASDNIGITNAQEYDNVGLGAPVDFLGHSQGGVIYPLTVANTQINTRGESPMYGALGFLKELIQKENGILYADNDFQLLTVNNGYSGATCESLQKGQPRYTRVTDLITSTKDLAAQRQQSFCFAATIWTQGHNNGTGSDYKALLKQVATDLNADGKAITGQPENHVLVTYQTSTSTSVAARQWVAGAQLAAANEHPLIYMACPTYFLPYADGVHWPALGAKWLGGYYGLALKRILVDRVGWEPLQPIAHAINGNTIDLIYNKMGLTLDTTLVAAQANSGFAVTASGGALKTINSVAVVAPNRIRLTMAAALAPGDTVYYGMTSNATGMGSFIGGAGNVRDNQGDYIVYDAISKPLHNWSVLFSYPI